MSLDAALTAIALVFGLIAGYRMLGRSLRATWARAVSSVWAQDAWAWVVAWGAVPVASDARDEAPSLAQDGPAPAPRDDGSGDVLHLTSVEIVRGLALVKRVDSEGSAEWLSKDRIAAVAGMRAAEARALIDEVRGTPPKPEPGPRFEQVGPSSYRRVEGT